MYQMKDAVPYNERTFTYTYGTNLLTESKVCVLLFHPHTREWYVQAIFSSIRAREYDLSDNYNLM